MGPDNVFLETKCDVTHCGKTFFFFNLPSIAKVCRMLVMAGEI